MGLGRKTLDLLAKTPKLNGCIAAATAVAFAWPGIQEHIEWNADIKYNPLKTALYAGTWAAIYGLSAFLPVHLSTTALRCFTKEDTGTKFSDFKTIKQLKQQLAKQQPPTIPFQGDTRISYSLTDMVKNHAIPFHSPKAENIEQQAQREKDPLLALDAGIEYDKRKEGYDKALLLMRDALHWLDGKKPTVKPSAKIAYAYYSLMLKTIRTLQPREVSNYMMSAIYESIMRPEHAWYWSQFGRMVADALDTPRKKEMYVFHALLATAQRRSDQQQAWQDAFSIMNETSTPERLGESRHPTWILKDEDTKFFSDTFAFQGYDKKIDSQSKWQARLRLESILGKDATPQPLYIIEEPHNGLYVYIMRYVSGELLANQLKKEEKSGLNQVIPVLARIHARYPTEGLPHVDITQKTYKKLEQLGMTDAMQLFKPVIEDLQAQPIWAVNADAHPEQWMMLNNPYVTAKTCFLDTELKEVQPAILDSANLLEYCGTFNTAQRQAFVLQFADNLREQGTYTNNPTLREAYKGNMNGLFKAHNNATLHRTLCLLVAWNEKGRNRTKEEKEHLVKNAIRAVQDLKTDNLRYYEQHEEQYAKLPEFYAKLIPS